jgi:ABC-type transporter Mla subunit MlaD
MNINYIILFVSLAVLALFFVVALIRLSSQLRSIRKDLDMVGDAFSKQDIDHDALLRGNSLLRRAWQRYRQTFLGDETPQQMTQRDAADFFSVAEVFPQRLNLRFWLAVPNMLVGLGILGTFIGLAFGVYDFDTTNTQTIQDSIRNLLDGMSTAFLTSIVGMTLSLIFNGYEKRQFKCVSDKLRDIVYKLDERYHTTAGDLYAQVFGYRTEDGHQVRPGAVLRDLRTEAVEQSAALKSFSTDLAESLGDIIERAMEAKLGPALGSLVTAVEALRQEKMDSNEQMVQDVVEELKRALGEMGTQFQDALSGGAIAQLDQVAATVAATGAVLKDLPDQIILLIDQLRTDLLDMGVKVSEETELSLNAMQEATKDSIDAFKASITELQARTEALNRQQGEHVGSIKEMADSVAGALQNTTQLVTNLGAMTETLNGTLVKLGDITTQFSQTARTLDNSSATLKSTTETLQSENAALARNYRDLFEKLDESMEMAQLVASDYAEKFGVIQEGLKGIFSEIDTGLKGYQTETRQSLNTYLADFADKLHTASNALSGSVEALEEILSDLSDQLEAFARQNGHR